MSLSVGIVAVRSGTLRQARRRRALKTRPKPAASRSKLSPSNWSVGRPVLGNAPPIGGFAGAVSIAATTGEYVAWEHWASLSPIWLPSKNRSQIHSSRLDDCVK
jgi:hypothetical protein